MKNKFILITGVAIAILAIGFFYNKYKVAPKIKLETFELADLDGNKISLDTFQKQKLFINFFATWCGPCIKELPSLFSAQQILSKENFQFVLISDEPVVLLKSFNERTGNKFLILHSEKPLKEHNIYTVPATYATNANHEIVFKKTGKEDWASDEMLKKLRESK